MHELKEGQVQRQLLLGNPTMGSQPGAQQRPKALHRIDMHLVKAVPIVIPRIFSPTVADRLVAIAPLRQPGVDIVFVGVNERARDD